MSILPLSCPPSLVLMMLLFSSPPAAPCLTLCLCCSVCSYWMDVHVKGTSLPRALQCWDRSLQNSLRNNSSHRAPPRACPLHLIDSCPWPHCNPTCPTIRDQMTGQEMSVIQFLTHMGFDVQRMAQQQGMEASTLLGMLNNGN